MAAELLDEARNHLRQAAFDELLDGRLLWGEADSAGVPVPGLVLVTLEWRFGGMSSL